MASSTAQEHAQASVLCALPQPPDFIFEIFQRLPCIPRTLHLILSSFEQPILIAISVFFSFSFSFAYHLTLSCGYGRPTYLFDFFYLFCTRIYIFFSLLFFVPSINEGSYYHNVPVLNAVIMYKAFSQYMAYVYHIGAGTQKSVKVDFDAINRSRYGIVRYSINRQPRSATQSPSAKPWMPVRRLPPCPKTATPFLHYHIDPDCHLQTGSDGAVGDLC